MSIFFKKKHTKIYKKIIFSQKSFLVIYLGQNIYKIYFLKAYKTKHLKNIIYIKNNKFLEIFFTKNRDLFHHPDFNSEDTLKIMNKNVFQLIKLLVELFDIENKLSLIYSNINISLYRSTKIKHKFQQYNTII